MFRLTNHHQGAYCCALLKLCLLKQSVKIRRYEFSAVVWLHNYPVLLACVPYAVQNETAFVDFNLIQLDK